MNMAERSSFFNSIGGDRKYSAEDWATYFGSLVGNGYFAGDSTALQVVAGSGMSVVVRAGRAFINGYFYKLDEDKTLDLNTADGVLSRIDRIVVRLSHIDRAIIVMVKRGEYASAPVAPELQRDEDAWELALADVLVGVGVTSVSAASITDHRLDSSLCGPVAALVDQIDTAAFVEHVNQLIVQLEQDIDGVKDGSAFLMRSGGTMTGELKLNVPLAIASGGHGGKTAEEGRTNLDVYSKAEALPRSAIVATTKDPGAGAAVDYPDGTVIHVYE